MCCIHRPIKSERFDLYIIYAVCLCVCVCVCVHVCVPFSHMSTYITRINLENANTFFVIGNSPGLNVQCVFNPRHACAARVGLSVCLSVCLSVDGTTGYEAAYELYKRVHIYEGIITRRFSAFGRYGVKTSEKANMIMSTRLPRRYL